MAVPTALRAAGSSDGQILTLGRWKSISTALVDQGPSTKSNDNVLKLNDPMCVRNDGVSLIPNSALATALEPTSLTDIWHLSERRSHAIGKVWAM